MKQNDSKGTDRAAVRPPEGLRGRWAPVAVLLAAGLLVTTWGLGERGLWSAHEARAARVAATLLGTGEWIVPQLSPGEPTYQKPPLYYWLVAAISWVGGGEVTPLSTRLPSAVATVLTALVVYLMGRDLKSHRAGLLAAVALLTCAKLLWISGVAVLDPLLALWITLTMYLFHRAYQPVEKARTRVARPPSGVKMSREPSFSAKATQPRAAVPHFSTGCYRSGRSWRGYLVVFVPVGLGLLTKGPMGAVLPGVVIVVFLLWETILTDRRVLLRTAARCLPGVVVALVIAAPWYVAVHVRTGGDFTREFFLYHHLARSGWVKLPPVGTALDVGEAAGIVVSQASWTDYLDGDKRGILVAQVLEQRKLDARPFEGKSPRSYYARILWGDTFPWSLFLPGAAAWLVVRRRTWEMAEPLALVVLWLAAGLVLVSLMSFRKSEYLLPMYPAAALLVGVFLDEVSTVRGRSRFWGWTLHLAFITLCVAAVVLAGGVLAMLSEGVFDWVRSKLGNENDRHMLALAHGQAAGHMVLTVAGAAALLAAFAGALWLWNRGRTSPAVALVGAAMAMLFVAYEAAIVPAIDESRSHQAFVRDVAAIVRPRDSVIVACGEDHELYYLLDRAGIRALAMRESEAASPQDAVARSWGPGRRGFLIVRCEQVDGLGLGAERREVVQESAGHVKALTMLGSRSEGERD